MTDDDYDKQIDAALLAWARTRWLEAVLPSQRCSANDGFLDDMASAQNVVPIRRARLGAFDKGD